MKGEPEFKMGFWPVFLLLVFGVWATVAVLDRLSTHPEPAAQPQFQAGKTYDEMTGSERRNAEIIVKGKEKLESDYGK